MRQIATLFSRNALGAAKVSLAPGGGQPLTREGWDYQRNLPHAMVFPENFPDISLRGEAKGLEVVLQGVTYGLLAIGDLMTFGFYCSVGGQVVNGMTQS